MRIKTLEDLQLKDKTVLLRCDLNSNVKNGKISLNERIIRSVDTIRELKKKKAKIVIIAHQGRPGKDDFISLEQHARLLNKFTKVRFIRDIIGEKAIKAIRNLRSSEAILLENIRFEKDEFFPNKKNNRLIKTLIPLVDFYINDAFSVCHREHTSIITFPRFLKSAAGKLLEKELNALKKIRLRNCIYILAGAKIEDNLLLLGKKKVLAAGLFGQACLIAKGKRLGAQETYLKTHAGFTPSFKRKLKSKLKRILTPVDFAVKIDSRRVELSLEDFPSNYEIFDIGEKTIALFNEEIRNASAIYMKGPVGDFSEKGFSKGTREILKALADSKAFTLIGGGHLTEAIKKFRIPEKKFGYVSLSGGALIRYLAGKKLPGIEALKSS